MPSIFDFLTQLTNPMGGDFDPEKGLIENYPEQFGPDAQKFSKAVKDNFLYKGVPGIEKLPTGNAGTPTLTWFDAIQLLPLLLLTNPAGSMTQELGRAGGSVTPDVQRDLNLIHQLDTMLKRGSVPPTMDAYQAWDLFRRGKLK